MQITEPISIKRRVITILLAWVLFIGVDFLFHASIFASLWEEKIPAFKSLENLALLIPAGYLSFLFLTALTGYLFFSIFRVKPAVNDVLKFGLIFGLLFSLANLFGLFSYVMIPLKHLLIFNFVYFIEILVVTLSIHFIAFSTNLKKSVLLSLLLFFALVILGIVIQNIL